VFRVQKKIKKDTSSDRKYALKCTNLDDKSEKNFTGIIPRTPKAEEGDPPQTSLMRRYVPRSGLRSPYPIAKTAPTLIPGYVLELLVVFHDAVEDDRRGTWSILNIVVLDNVAAVVIVGKSGSVQFSSSTCYGLQLACNSSSHFQTCYEPVRITTQFSLAVTN
jgi:hypothetical protein